MDEEERALVALVIGYRIRAARRSRHLSQAEMAHGIGSQSMISLLESGRQLPAPDVLHLIASRLQDDVLLSYAKVLNQNAESFGDFAADNRTVLIQALRAHRGRWLDIHSKLAVQLCESFYTDRIFNIVDEICQLIMNHHTSEAAYSMACFYYGSTLLFSQQYDLALKWLNAAVDKSDVLDERTRGRLCYNLAYAQYELDRCGSAIWYAKLAVDTFLRIDDYPHHAKSLGLLGVIQAELGAFDDARRTLEHAYDMMTRWDVHETDILRVATSIADVCESIGDLGTAEHWCHVVMESQGAEPDYLSMSAVHQTLSLAHMARDEREQAVEEAWLAVVTAERTQDARVLCHAQLLAASMLNEPERSISLAEQAYLGAKKFGHTLEEAAAADCLAEFLSASDDNRARWYRSVALDTYRKHFLRGSRWSSLLRYLTFAQVPEE